MELNKIYDYYGISADDTYEHLKEKFTEAFSGFEGVSFVAVPQVTDESGAVTKAERYRIYLNEENSVYLDIYNGVTDNAVDTKKNYVTAYLNGIHSGHAMSITDNGSYYRAYSICRTRHGVVFSEFSKTSGTGGLSSYQLRADRVFTNFFSAEAKSNIFIHRRLVESSNNIYNNSTLSTSHYLYSNLHAPGENIEITSQPATLCKEATQTFITNACSPIVPIQCEHLYRLLYYADKAGKIKVGDKNVILGIGYALEYDPSDNEKEVNYAPAISEEE